MRLMFRRYVAECFRSLTFSHPEGGPVTVVYPIVFRPAE